MTLQHHSHRANVVKKKRRGQWVYIEQMGKRTNATRTNGHRTNGNRKVIVAPFNVTCIVVVDGVYSEQTE